MNPIDPARCPLCGRPNACRLQTGDSTGKACWCRKATIPQELISHVPAGSRNRACICEACVSAFHAASAGTSRGGEQQPRG